MFRLMGRDVLFHIRHIGLGATPPGHGFGIVLRVEPRVLLGLPVGRSKKLGTGTRCGLGFNLARSQALALPNSQIASVPRVVRRRQSCASTQAMCRISAGRSRRNTYWSLLATPSSAGIREQHR